MPRCWRYRSAMKVLYILNSQLLGLRRTDASIYQVEPLGVVVPKTVQDVEATLSITHENEVPILARGAGTSQCGQTVNRALVVDTTKYLDQVISFDPDFQSFKVFVEPFEGFQWSGGL